MFPKGVVLQLGQVRLNLDISHWKWQLGSKD